MYILMLSTGRLEFPIFNMLVIYASEAGNLDDLVVLKPNTLFHNKLEIEPDNIVIVDKHKKFLTKHSELVKVEDDYIDVEYLEYIKNN